MSGEQKLTSDGRLLLDSAGAEPLSGTSTNEPCCECDCGCPQATEEVVIDAIPCMPCRLKISLKELCRCFCWRGLSYESLYTSYFPVGGYRFQFRDWNNWLDQACTVATPASSSPFGEYRFSFPKLIPLYAYPYTVPNNTCDCPEEYGNRVYLGDQTCASNFQSVAVLTGQTLSGAPYTPVPSAWLKVGGSLSFIDEGGVAKAWLRVSGNIFAGTSFADIGLSFPGCAASVDYSGSAKIYLFMATIAVPVGWTDGAGNVLSPLVLSNNIGNLTIDGSPVTFPTSSTCGAISGGLDTLAATGGSAIIDATTEDCDTGHSDACPTYTPNCCQNDEEYNPCGGIGDQFTPDSWTATGSGITMQSCTPTGLVEPAGRPYVRFFDNTTDAQADLDTTFCVPYVDATTGFQKTIDTATFDITKIVEYTDACSTVFGSTTNASSFQAKCRIWRKSGDPNWWIEVWSESVSFSNPNSTKAVWFRGATEADCDSTIVFTNLISTATTNFQTDVNTDSGWNVSRAAFVASGGTITITKCCA